MKMLGTVLHSLLRQPPQVEVQAAAPSQPPAAQEKTQVLADRLGESEQSGSTLQGRCSPLSPAASLLSMGPGPCVAIDSVLERPGPLVATVSPAVKAEITAAVQDMTHRTYYRRLEALRRFQTLVYRRQGYPEAIQAAVQGMAVRELRDEAFTLFLALVEKGQGYPEAIACAAQYAFRQDRQEYFVRELCLTLFQRGQGVLEMIAAAKAHMGRDDRDERIEALKLFTELVEHKQGYPEAIAAAVQGANSPSWLERAEAFKLFQALATEGQGCEEISIIATRYMAIDTGAGLGLFKRLARKAQGPAAARALAAAENVLRDEAAPEAQRKVAREIRALLT